VQLVDVPPNNLHNESTSSHVPEYGYETPTHPTNVSTNFHHLNLRDEDDGNESEPERPNYEAMAEGQGIQYVNMLFYEMFQNIFINLRVLCLWNINFRISKLLSILVIDRVLIFTIFNIDLILMFLDLILMRQVAALEVV